MTADAFARLLRARRIGRGKWMARCPAHDDRLHSLSITDMGDGNIRPHCFAGCPQSAILDAMGLSWRDLRGEDRRMMSAADIRKLEARRKAEEAEELRQRRRRSRLIEQSRIRTGDVYRIANLLSRDFESDKLARQFHWALDRQREAERATIPFFHPAFIVEGSLISLPSDSEGFTVEWLPTGKPERAHRA